MLTLVSVREDTGEVVQITRGKNVVIPDDGNGITHHLVDCDVPKVPSRYVRGKFVPIPQSKLVQPYQILAVRDTELKSTDWMVMPDSPEPSPEWLAYRQALRDITSGGRGVKAMINRFPVRPDGKDAISQYR